jgi:hypothetical protein
LTNEYVCARGSDLLEETEGMARWLAGHGLFPDGVAEVSEADRRRLTSFREGLRKGGRWARNLADAPLRLAAKA